MPKYAEGERIRCFAAAHKAAAYPPDAESWTVVRYLPRTDDLSARYVVSNGHEDVTVFASSVMSTAGGRA